MNHTRGLQTDILKDNASRNAAFFEEEFEKLDKWAEEKKTSIELLLKLEPIFF